MYLELNMPWILDIFLKVYTIITKCSCSLTFSLLSKWADTWSQWNSQMHGRICKKIIVRSQGTPHSGNNTQANKHTGDSLTKTILLHQVEPRRSIVLNKKKSRWRLFVTCSLTMRLQRKKEIVCLTATNSQSQTIEHNVSHK